ncbi:MAG: hypothetical protein GXY03_12445 [Solirubrobacterales bacterium]|nr:hypothetical protein [Solirubrobacterales bacterium]
MAITLNREQRDAMYSQLRTDITGFNDIELNLRAGDFDAARRQSQRMSGTAACSTASLNRSIQPRLSQSSDLVVGARRYAVVPQVEVEVIDLDIDNG